MTKPVRLIIEDASLSSSSSGDELILFTSSSISAESTSGKPDFKDGRFIEGGVGKDKAGPGDSNGPGSSEPGRGAGQGKTKGGDVGSQLSISANVDQAEGNSGTTAFTFTVTRTGDTSGTSSAAWTVSGSGTDAASEDDFDSGASFPTGTVTFAAGETSKTITVNVNGDTDVEEDETFLVTLSAPSAGTTLKTGESSATGTIQNDDSTSTRTRIFVLAQEFLTGASTTGYTIDGSGGAAFVDIDADGLLDANEINTSNIARFGAGGNVNLGSGSYDIEFIRTGGASAFIDFTGFGADDSIVVNYTQEWAGSGMPTAKSQLAILQRGKFEAISPTPGMGGKFSGYTYSSYTKRLLSTPGVGAFIRGQTAIKSIAGSGTEIALKIGINGNLNAGTLWAYFTNFGVIPGRFGAALLLAVNLSDPSVQPSQISVVWPDTYPPV